MSTTIDQRVVEMRFDNKQFEAGVSTTMSTLDKFKEKLSLKGSAKAVESEFAAYKSGFISFKDSMNKMWSTWEYEIASKMKNIVKSFTIEPIKTGFSEYETQMGAIQTILANTKKEGTTLEDVNGALDELNLYADKTIYNFTEMTRNIGTFTAAGVKLDTSVQAIKGIANLAAVSGSTSQQASTAMYQLSQAMASGTVKLMDWNSVVNAGMGGQVFQDALKETAKVHGIKIDEIIEKQGSFRESLTEGWLTTEILTETLAKFTGDLTEEQLKSMGYTEKQIKEIIELGKTANAAATEVKTFSQLFDTLKEAAQSGWSQTWRILVGDFEEAKELLTQISEVVGGFIGKSADARNELLENWKVMGGRQDLIDSFKNVFEAVVSVIKPIKDAFRDIFPPMTAERLVAITKGLKEFTAKLKLSSKSSENLKRTFKGLFSIIKIIVSIFKALFKAVGIVLGGVGKLGGGILGITAIIGDFLSMVAEGILYLDIFDKAFTGIAKVIKFVISIVAGLVKGMANLFDFAAQGLIFPGFVAIIELLKSVVGGMKNVGDSADGMGERVSNALSAMRDALAKNPIFKFFSTIWNGIKKVGAAIWKVIKNVFGGIYDVFANGSISEILDFINGLITGGIGIAIINFIKNLGGTVKSFKETWGTFDEVLQSIGGSFKAFQNSLNAEALKNVAVAIAILTASLLVLSLIDKEKLADSIAAMTLLFTDLAVATKLMGTVGFGKGMPLIALSLAVLILSAALKSISEIDSEEMANGIVGLSAVMALLITSMKIMSAGTDKVAQPFMKSCIQMIVVAKVVQMLAGVLKDLSYFEWKEMGIGLAGLAGVMAILVIAMKILSASGSKAKEVEGEVKSASKSITGIGFALIEIAIAIAILTPAIKKLGGLSWQELAKAGTVFAGLLVVLALFSLELKSIDGNTIKKTASSLLIISAALTVLALALKMYVKMDWKTLGKAGAVMGALLVFMGIFALESKLVKPGSITTLAASMIILAVALTALLPPLLAFSLMSWNMLAKAGTVLGGLVVSLAVLGTISKFVSPAGISTLAASLIILAAGLTALVIPLLIFGAMKWKSLAVGLIAIAGAFTVLGIAGLFLKSLTPIILSLTVSMALLGVAALAFGTGLVMIGAGIAAIGSSFAVLGTGLAVGLRFIILTLAEVIPLAIQRLAEGIGLGIIAICKVVSDGAPAIGEAVIAIIETICNVILECLPTIANTLLELIVVMLDVFSNYAPQIVESLGRLIVGVIQGLAKFVPDLVDALFNIIVLTLEGIARNIPILIRKVVDIFVSIFQGAADALASIDPGVLLKGVAAIGVMAILMKILGGVAALVPGAMVGLAGVGLVLAELVLILAAIGAIASIKGLKDLVDKSGGLLESVGTAIGRLVGGLVGGIVGGIGSGLSKSLPTIATSLSQFMTNITPFFEGAKNIDPVALSGIKTLVAAVLLMSAASFVSGIGALLTGGLSLATFPVAVASLGTSIRKFADEVKGVDANAVKTASKAAQPLTLAVTTMAVASFISGVGALMTGGLSLATFPLAVGALGTSMRKFADEVKGIDTSAVKTAANASQPLTLAVTTMTIASFISGVGALMTGGLSLATFPLAVGALGTSIRKFSDEVTGIDNGAVKAASKASQPLTLAVTTMTIASFISGVAALMTGGLSLVTFPLAVAALGTSIRKFSDEVTGIDTNAVKTAANASQPLTLAVITMTATSFLAGVGALLTGGLSLVTFPTAVATLGTSIWMFSKEVSGIDTNGVSTAANASIPLVKAVIAMTGASFLAGVGALLTGGLSLVTFPTAVATLGASIWTFSKEVSGIDTNGVVAAANASQPLTRAVITMTGASFLAGVGALMTGGLSLVTFPTAVATLGTSIKMFSKEVSGIDTNGVVAAANASGPLVTAVIAMTGASVLAGIGAFLTAGLSLTTFPLSVASLGSSIRKFSDEVTGIDTSGVTAAANASGPLVKAVLAMTGASVLAGIVALLTAGFANGAFEGGVESLGKAIASFSKHVNGVNPSAVEAAANAAGPLAKAVAAMSGAGFLETLKDLLTCGLGDGKFKDAVSDLGSAIKSFASKVQNINPDAVRAATSAAISLSSMVATIPKDTSNMVSFGSSVSSFGGKLAEYFNKISGITTDKINLSRDAINAINLIPNNVNVDGIKSITTAINDIISAIKNLSSVPGDITGSLTRSLKDLSAKCVEGFTDEFNKLPEGIKRISKESIDAAISAANGRISKATEAFGKIATKCADAVSDKESAFKSAGKALVQGLADGISANSYLAEAKARTMAEAAAEEARRALDINSPSKVFRDIGYSIPEGLALGIDKMSNIAVNSVESMTDDSINGVKNSISRIADFVNSDIDSQPTIRPVLDLSDVKSGVDSIGRMFSSNAAIGVTANVGAINTMMNRRNQNGANNDVVSAIKELAKDMGNSRGDTYNLGNISYDDGSSIANAVKDLVRAARVERRV